MFSAQCLSRFFCFFTRELQTANAKDFSYGANVGAASGAFRGGWEGTPHLVASLAHRQGAVLAWSSPDPQLLTLAPTPLST